MIRGQALTAAIYADYQASTPMDPRVAEQLGRYFAEQSANPHSEEHAFGWRAAEQLRTASEQIAQQLNCDPDEIIFTSGATEANNLALLGLAAHNTAQRRRVIVSAVEHKSVLAAARATQHYGCTVEILPVNSEGIIALDRLENLLDDDVLAVSVMTVNNEVGSIQPVGAIAALCEKYGCWFHTDAAQALACENSLLTHLPRASLISLSAHKIYGPQGIGVLYAERIVQKHMQPVIHGGGQQANLRSGTVPVPLCRSFADALALMHGPAASCERDRIRKLRDSFVAHILTLDGVKLNGPPLADRHPGNANLCFTGLHAKDLLQNLQPAVAASTGAACTSGAPEPSHALLAMGLSHDDAESAIRFSLGRFTTEVDVHRLFELVSSAVRHTRTQDEFERGLLVSTP